MSYEAYRFMRVEDALSGLRKFVSIRNVRWNVAFTILKVDQFPAYSVPEFFNDDEEYEYAEYEDAIEGVHCFLHIRMLILGDLEATLKGIANWVAEASNISVGKKILHIQVDRLNVRD